MSVAFDPASGRREVQCDSCRRVFEIKMLGQEALLRRAGLSGWERTTDEAGAVRDLCPACVRAEEGRDADTA